MIVQPTLDQTRRVNRQRTYSGPGFGPRSFECLGLGMGLGLGMVASSGAGATLTGILAGVPLAWMFDAGAAGSGASPTGNGNTLPTPTTLSLLKDQSGNGIDWTAMLAVQTYAASGGPNGNAYFSTNGNSYVRAPYVSPAPGTTPSFTFLICRINAYNLNGALYSASNAQQIAGSSAGKYTARNLTASAEVAATAGVWMCVYMQLQNTAADILRMGSAQTTGTALGNAAGTTYNFLGVDAAFLDASYAFGFKTLGAITGPQISAIVSMYSSGRFSGVQF